MNLSKKIEFDTLYNNFRKPLFRYILHKVSDEHSAEEILNDVFFKASKSINSLKERDKIKSWLYKITSNTIIDHYRKRKDSFVEINDDILEIDNIEDETVFQSLSCCIDDYINRLPKQYASTLKSVYIDEQTQTEYAKKSNKNISTVKSQIKRSKESLKLFFEQCCEFEKDRFGKIVGYTQKNSCDCKSSSCK